MNNLRMQWKLDHSECIDLSSCERTTNGWYVMTQPPIVDGKGMDYCDAIKEEWIWIIGSVPVDIGVRYLAGKFNDIATLNALPGFKQLWLR